MKNITSILLLLSVFAIGLSGCSKEKKIEKHLSSKSGKWNNTLYEYKYYQDGTLEDVTTYPNAGFIEFQKGGGYDWTFTMDGTTTVSYGSWTNTDTQLSLTEGGNTTVWTILEESKKTLKIEYTETSTEFGDEKEVYTLTFEKSK